MSIMKKICKVGRNLQQLQGNHHLASIFRHLFIAWFPTSYSKLLILPDRHQVEKQRSKGGHCISCPYKKGQSC